MKFSSYYLRTMLVCGHLWSPTLITAPLMHRTPWNLMDASLPHIPTNLLSLFFGWTSNFDEKVFSSSRQQCPAPCTIAIYRYVREPGLVCTTVHPFFVGSGGSLHGYSGDRDASHRNYFTQKPNDLFWFRTYPVVGVEDGRNVCPWGSVDDSSRFWIRCR